MSDKSTNLYISPHLDDVVLSCGGLIARQSQAGQRNIIVTVFAGEPKLSFLSSYARHLHAKWGVADEQAVFIRKSEDKSACKVLKAVPEHWGFLEAPYRFDEHNVSLYCNYEALRGESRDPPCFIERLKGRILSRIEQTDNTTGALNVYFPLGIAKHVDHQLLAEIGLSIKETKFEVKFYEEYPYVENYHINSEKNSVIWDAIITTVPIEDKIRAALCYVSQHGGLGGTPERVAIRLRNHASRLNLSPRSSERVWKLSRSAKVDRIDFSNTPLPLTLDSNKKWSLRRFYAFIRTLTWQDIGSILPRGRGICLDLGCGSGRHRQKIESAGYEWVGLDIKMINSITLAPFVIGEVQHLPIKPQSVECIVLWQVLEYVRRPEQVFKQASQVLCRGG